MKRIWCALIIAGCSSAPVVEDSEAEMSLSAQCEAAAQEFEARGTRLTGTAGNSTSAYVNAFKEFQTVRETLKAGHPCQTEGPDVVARNQTFQSLKSKGAQVSEDATITALQAAGADLDATATVLKTRFASGDPPQDIVRRMATDYSQTYGNRLWAEFQNSKRYADMGEAGTTCIFARQELDPQREMEKLYASIFGGPGDVHALCRVPLPASRFSGDPNGTIEIVLDNDEDLTNGTLATVKLGSIENFKETQYFRARFALPHAQAYQDKLKSAYYHVSVRFARPEMGDEVPVSNGFFWWDE